MMDAATGEVDFGTGRIEWPYGQGDYVKLGAGNEVSVDEETIADSRSEVVSIADLPANMLTSGAVAMTAAQCHFCLHRLPYAETSAETCLRSVTKVPFRRVRVFMAESLLVNPDDQSIAFIFFRSG